MFARRIDTPTGNINTFGYQRQFRGDDAQVDVNGGKIWAGAIMQFTGKSPPRISLHGDKVTRRLTQSLQVADTLLFHFFSFSHARLKGDPQSGESILVCNLHKAWRKPAAGNAHP